MCSVSLAGHTTLAAVPSGQGLKQIGELGLAFGLSALIGLEREWRQKSAGLRTHTLVGVGAALFVLVSKYGFSNILGEGVVLDPSRVAAQVVSGIGFIGGGIIFVRQDAVRGLTTAAGVWVTAAVGLAAAAGQVLLAVATTAAYMLVAFGFPAITRQLPRPRSTRRVVQVTYQDGRGVLRDALRASTREGFVVADATTHRLSEEEVVVRLELQGAGPLDEVLDDLRSLDGVLAVSAEVEDAE
jgi:putative Mg2+ transporter-C (MgtC) family protein